MNKAQEKDPMRQLEYMDINETMAKFGYIPIGLKYFKSENGILDLEQGCRNLCEVLQQDLKNILSVLNSTESHEVKILKVFVCYCNFFKNVVKGLNEFCFMYREAIYYKQSEVDVNFNDEYER